MFSGPAVWIDGFAIFWFITQYTIPPCSILTKRGQVLCTQRLWLTSSLLFNMILKSLGWLLIIMINQHLKSKWSNKTSLHRDYSLPRKTEFIAFCKFCVLRVAQPHLSLHLHVNKKPPKCLRWGLLEGLLSSQRQQNIEIRGVVNPDSVRIQNIRTRCILQYVRHT